MAVNLVSAVSISLVDLLSTLQPYSISHTPDLGNPTPVTVRPTNATVAGSPTEFLPNEQRCLRPISQLAQPHPLPQNKTRFRVIACD